MMSRLFLRKIAKKIITIMVFMSFVFFSSAFTVLAASMVLGGEFEGDPSVYWKMWQPAQGGYDMYRSYETAYGSGSYSLAIDATATGNRWDAGLVSNEANNKFDLVSGKKYFVEFYVKAKNNATITTYFQDSVNYETASEQIDVPVTTEWNKVSLSMTANRSAKALLVISFGDMGVNNTLYLDNIQIIDPTFTMATTEVKGKIGEKKVLRIAGISSLNPIDVAVELPYYDPQTSAVGAKSFAPESIDASGINFIFPTGTFSGIGKVLVKGIEVGKFDYNVTPTITNTYPKAALVQEDMVIEGTGFNPQINISKMYVIMKVMDTNGKTSDHWAMPHTIDTELSQIAVNMPVGAVAGSLYVQTAFRNSADKDVQSKSNAVRYEIKPVITTINWAKKGYSQVGDSLLIRGYGIASKPTVNFYDLNNVLITSKSAKLIEVSGDEVIQVVTPRELNKLKITVKVGNYESDIANAIEYLAKPVVTTAKSRQTRNILYTNGRISGAMVGDQITITGYGFVVNGGTVNVLFSGLDGQVTIPVDAANITSAGTSIKVVVPSGAVSGPIYVQNNNELSNAITLEIIPQIISVDPLLLTPGENMALTVNGIGKDTSKLKLIFVYNNNTEKNVAVDSVEFAQNGSAVLRLKTPYSVSMNSSGFRIQYAEWKNKETFKVAASPKIIYSYMDRDEKILVLKGGGFSTVKKDNKLQFKLADADKTPVEVKHEIMSITDTEEGQEIKVRINDRYYYGYVSVDVNGKISNEFNFGPALISRIVRRTEFVKAEGRVMGVLYISGYNFGTTGQVLVGETVATTHYRKNNFIIAVVEPSDINKNPVLITR